MRTKPFDLKEALAGAKVVTRDGREVTELHHYVNITNTEYVLCGRIGTLFETWATNGEFSSDGSCILDLFLLDEFEPEIKPGWYNLYLSSYGNDIGICTFGRCYPTKQKAKEVNSRNSNYITTVYIEQEQQ
jgi:hypothetical protein